MDPVKGVQFDPPAPSIRAAAEAIVRRAARELPRGFNHAVISYDTERGMNAAIVHRAGDYIEIVGWIGKAPGERVEGGGQVLLTWR
jgi:hypothetical protein